MFQLRQLKIFVAAVETLSFTQAAKRVHLSQPSVTEQVRALEESVGQPLFVRHNNRLELTLAGETLARRARELLAMADDTLREVRGNADDTGGTIRVAAPQTLCASLLVPRLLRFAAGHPDVQVEVQERNSQATAQAVLGGTADLGVVHGWPAPDADLQAEVIAWDMPVLVTRPSHALARADEVGPEALAALPLVVTMPGCRYRDYLEALLQEASVRPRIAGTADSVATLTQMVAAGLGVAILPRMALDPAESAPRVAWRPLATRGQGLPICLLTTRRVPAGPVAAIIALMRLATTPSDQPVSTIDVQHGATRVAVAE